MTLTMPSRRLLQSASALTSPSPSTLLLALPSSARLLSTTSPRLWFFGKKKAKPDASSTALEQTASGTVSARKELYGRLSGRLQAPAMFQDEVSATAPTPEDSPSTSGRPKKDPRTYTPWGASLVREHLARGADPDPRSRVRWERKMVIRQISRGTDAFSKEPREEKIMRTERVVTSKSPFLATSVKKLVHLARQVQGKTVEEALTQMRYSKKKMAKEVKVQLEMARDVAIAERGMGLGKGKEGGKEVEIRTKDGKFVKVDDPTRMYVSEAWVGRGPWRGRRLYFMGRGRVSVHMKPSTSISIRLKEEKTRIREHEERQAKKYRQGPWVHLPDRPVTAQRPYYTW